MQAGAFDFLQKPFRDQQLIDCIQRALKKDVANRAALNERGRIQKRLASLTPREHEVLLLVADGKANKIMAVELGVSQRTIEIPPRSRDGKDGRGIARPARADGHRPAGVGRAPGN